MSVSVVGFFCEDIREERDGAVTILAAMPDNVAIANFVPGGATVIPRFALYARVHYLLSEPVKSISLKLVLPDGRELDIGPVDDAIPKAAVDGATAKGGLLCSIVLKLSLGPFPVVSLGWMKFIVTVDGKEFLAANARFNTDPPVVVPLADHTRQIVQRL